MVSSNSRGSNPSICRTSNIESGFFIFLMLTVDFFAAWKPNLVKKGTSDPHKAHTVGLFSRQVSFAAGV